MATTKVSQLTELTSAADDDLFLVSDVSTNQSKKITKANLGISDENFTSALKTKLDGIETAADVTDTANVTSAGALMDSEVTNLDQVKAFDSTDYATAAQGTTADSALQDITGESVGDLSDVTITSATSGQVLKYNGSAWVNDADTDTDTGILNVSEDTTPQLGGDLDLNSNNITGVGNFTTTGYIEIQNTTGYGKIEVGGSTGAFLDLKSPNSDDYDGRLITTGSDLTITSPAGVKIQYGNSDRLTTNLNGVDVTGEITADGIALGDSEKATFGASDDLQIYHTGGSSIIKDAGTGTLWIGGSGEIALGDPDVTEYFVRCYDDGAVNLYYDNSAKLATTSSGVSVTGRAAGTQTTDNDGSFDLSASNHFVCTPTANFTLTFTNHTAGQSGTIILINSGGYTVSAASTTKVMGADLLTTITTAGTYVIGYISDGTNTRIYNSGIQQ